MSTENDLVIDPDGTAPDSPAAGVNAAPPPSPGPEVDPALEAERLRREKESIDLLDPFSGAETEKENFPGGLLLEPFSITTMGWMRRAGSLLLSGKVPEKSDMPGILREISIYVLAHNSAIPPAERSRIFRGVNGPGGESDLEEQIDLALRKVPLSAAKGLFALVQNRIAEDLREMPIPEKPKRKAGPGVLDAEEHPPGN